MESKNDSYAESKLKRTGDGGFLPEWAMGPWGFVIVLTLIVLFASCSNPAPAPGADVTAGKIIENPKDYVGKTLTVSGEVERVVGPRAFLMDSGVNLGELLVIGAEPFPQVPDTTTRAYVVDDTAKVTGTVRMLVIADIEREIGWDVDPQIEIEFRDRPVLIAKTTSFTRGASTSGTAATASPPAANSSGGADVKEPVTDLLIIVTPPDRLPLVGKRVLFTDVKVQSMAGDRSFWIGPSATQRLFVRLDKALDKGRAESIVNVNQGQVRTLSGTIRRAPGADEVKQWGLGASDAAAIERDEVYLAADQIELLDKKP